MADPSQIVQLLDLTLDATKHKKAESALKLEEKKAGYSIQLLKIVSEGSLPVKTRLAASLCFKNFIKFNYVDGEGNYKLPAQEVATIKQELIGLMIVCPPTIQTQLGAAISVIADSDFWKRWETLVPDLVSRLTPNDAKVNNGVLEVAHSIFQRWRPLYRSDDLYIEINHVLANFADPFLTLLSATDQQITANANNQPALKAYFDTMSLLIRVFYDLSCQEMPPQFESNLEQIATLLHKYMTYENPLLATDDDSEAGVLENIKADICEVLQLYTSKYDEDFARYTQLYITSAWNLLSSIGPETKYDNLVSKALHFLTAVAGADQHAQIFNDENVLDQIVSKVVLPNVALRETDIELFEDEPIEFIRRDLEGSDKDSRRRAATDFLRTLQEKFEQLVTSVAGRYIQHYLDQGKTQWKDKDTAISLFLSIAAKGAVTAGQGVKTVNSLVNVVEFFGSHVHSDLTGDGVEPMLKVDAIKYLYTFRSQLTREQWQSAFQPLVQNLESPNYVVYTYAAIAVERVLFLTDDSGTHFFTRADIEHVAKGLLAHLFQLVEKDTASAKMQENEFLMRCIMRVLIVMKDGVMPFADMVLDQLVAITNVIKENPSNPRFYYYHFEALGALVRAGSASGATTKLEERLWQPFNQILTEEVNEFVPYVLQLFAALLESNPSAALPEHYQALIAPLLQHTIWETRGNVPGCTRLLAAVIPRAAQQIVAGNQVEPVLGIFHKLLMMKKMENQAFDLLETVVVSIPRPTLEPYFGTVIGLLLTKLDNLTKVEGNPSESYQKRLVRFYHLVSAKTDAGLGADFFIQQTNAIQDGIFVPLYLKTILIVSPKFASPIDRKLAVISFAKTLAESQAFAHKYIKGWAYTVETFLTMMANAPVVTKGGGDDIITEADVDDIGFGLGFTALNSCKKPSRDDFPEIPDVPQWGKQYISQQNAQRGGHIEKFAVERLTPDARAAFVAYLS